MKRLFVYLILAFLLFAGCSPTQKDSNSILIPVDENQKKTVESPLEDSQKSVDSATPNYTTYTVDIQIDPKRQLVMAIEKITYTNNSKIPLDQLYMNVYANTFAADNLHPPYWLEDLPLLFPNGKDFAQFQILNLTMNNDPLSYSLSDASLRILLPDILEPGESVNLTMQFECYIPNILYRIGTDNNNMWFGNFIPQIAVFDGVKWQGGTYSPALDSIYGDIANYEMTITAPTDYSVIAPGSVVSTPLADGKTLTTVSVRMLRDFSFVLGKNLHKSSQTTSDGLILNLYHTPMDQGQVDLFLDYAQKNMEFYTTHIGSYPYHELNIIELNIPALQEADYPQMIFLDRSHIKSFTRYTLPVDYGMQWFGKVVGFHQNNQSFLSKGITEFLKYYLRYTPQELNDILKKEYDATNLYLQENASKPLNTPASDYYTRLEYETSYLSRSRLMIYSLYQKIGSEKLFEILKLYYSSYSFKNASLNDFIKICNQITDTDTKNFFDSWIYSDTLPEL